MIAYFQSFVRKNNVAHFIHRKCTCFRVFLMVESDTSDTWISRFIAQNFKANWLRNWSGVTVILRTHYFMNMNVFRNASLKSKNYKKLPPTKHFKHWNCFLLLRCQQKLLLHRFIRSDRFWVRAVIPTQTTAALSHLFCVNCANSLCGRSTMGWGS